MKYTLALLAIALASFTSAFPHPIAHPVIATNHYTSNDLYGRGLSDAISMETRDAIMEERGTKDKQASTSPAKSSDGSMHGGPHGKDGQDKGSTHGDKGNKGDKGDQGDKDGHAKASPSSGDTKSAAPKDNDHHHKGGMA